MDKMDSHYTGFRSDNKGRSRELRREMTPQERRLWYCFLKNYPIKIYRQRSIDRFVVDFYCSRAHIVIEIDGGQHVMPEGKRYDEMRDQILQGYGLEVIRIYNTDIDRNFEGVCEWLDRKLKSRLPFQGSQGKL